MCREKNAERSHNIEIDDCFFERVAEFQVFGNNHNKSKLFRKKLRDRSQGLLAIRCRIVFLPVIQKCNDKSVQNYNFDWCMWV
jgi:hypothetical protein